MTRISKAVACAIIVAGWACIPGTAATIVWNNSGTTFSTGANWVGGTAPTNNTTTDIGSFQAATVSFNPNLTASRSIAGLQFTSGTGAWTFTGSGGTRVLTLGASGIVNNSSSTQTFTGGFLRLSLGTNSTFNGNSGSLVFNASMAGLYLNSFNLTLDGSSTTNTIAEVMSGTGGSLTKIGTGTWTLSGVNTYTGAINIGTAGGANGGTLAYGVNNALAAGAVNVYGGTLDIKTFTDTIGALNLGGGASGTTANVTGSTGTLTLGGNLAYNATNNPNGAVVSANLNLGGANRTFTVNDSSAATTDLTISGNVGATNRNLIITGAGNSLVSGNITTGTGGINKQGTGTLTLSGTNTYTGVTTFTAGTVSVATIGNGGVAGNLGQAASTANRLVFLGGTLQYTGASASTNRNFTLAAGSSGTIDVTNAGTNLTISGASISTTGSLTKTGDGTLTLSGANLHTGGTSIGTSGGVSGGTLVYGANNVLSTGAVNVYAGTLDINTRTDTIGALNLGGGASGTTANVTGSTGTLTLGGNLAYNATNNPNGAVVSANLNLGGANRTFTVNDSSAATTDLTISGNVGATNRNLIITGAGNSLVSGNITTGTGTLTKSGTGTLTLSGTNTYSGTTSVSAGTLLANSNAALGATTGTSSVSSGATLALGGGINLTKSGTLSLAGTGTSASTGALHAAGSSGQTSQWTGNIALTGNATITAADNLLIIGDDLNFDNTINLSTYTLTLHTTSATGVTPTYLPAPLYILDPTNIYISSTLSGTGGLTKTGDGTVSLLSQTFNTYSGATTVTGGKLIVAGVGDAPVVSSSVVTVGNALSPGAVDSVVLQMGVLASAPSANNLIGTYDSGTNTASTSLTVLSDGLFNMNGGSNAFTTLTLEGGHVTGADLSAYNPLLTLTGGITTNASSRTALIEETNLGLSANGFTIATASGTAPGGIDLQIDAIVQNGVGFTNSDASTSLAKTGAGTLVLTASNVYQGVTDIQAGIVNIRSNTALGQTGPSIGSLDNSTTVQSGAQLQVLGGLTIGSETLTLSGTGVGGTGALRNVGGTNTLNGLVRLEADTRINADTGTTLNLTNPGGVNATIVNGTSAGKNLTVGGEGNTAINGAIGAFVNDLTKDGNGTLTLAGNNAYTGATAVTDGIVKVTHNSGLSGTGVTVSDGAALQFAQDAGNNDIAVGAVGATISGTGVSNGGAVQNLTGTNSYAGAITLGANSRITADSGSALTLSGNVTGAGFALDAGGAGNTTYSGAIGGTGTSVTKTDGGTVTLSGGTANTFTGDLTVNDGTLNLNKTAGVNAVGAGSNVIVGDNIGLASSANLVYQAGNQLPDATDITLNSDGRLALGTFSDAVSTLSGTGLLDLGASGELILGADGGASLFSGSITGSGNLEVSALGNLTLGSDISYTGSLTLAGGTLVLNDSDLTVTSLEITGNSVIDFAGTSSSLFTTNLIFANTSVTLTILNWAMASDYLLASNWAGAIRGIDAQGQIPMNQITFDGWSNNETGWEEYTDRIRPNVPEPSTYGLILTGAGLALFGYRRWRAARRQAGR